MKDDVFIKEKVKIIAEMFECFCNLDFANITRMFNMNGPYDFSEDKAFNCSNYIDVSKKKFTCIDIQCLIKGCCDKAMISYFNLMKDYQTKEGSINLKECKVDFFAHGISVKIDTELCSIEYVPVYSATIESNVDKEIL